jgi:hypothetical protein
LDEAGVDETVLITWILNKSVGKTWAGLIWLRIRTSGELLQAVIKFRVPQNTANFLTA